jgi:hypothetical protein
MSHNMAYLLIAVAVVLLVLYIGRRRARLRKEG